jgi:hypothetical protein
LRDEELLILGDHTQGRGVWSEPTGWTAWLDRLAGSACK